MKTQRLSSLRPSRDLPSLNASLAGTQQRIEGQSWYSIRNVSRDEAEIAIYDEIGGWGVTASDFIRELNDLKAERISVRVNSPGGDVFDGTAIYNALKRHTAEITVYVDGLAASAASFIAMAGDKVLMSPHSQMMIHDASGFAMGNAADMRKLADVLDSISNSIAGIYADRAGGTVAEWRAKMLDESWYTDQQAVDAGLADAIVGKEDAPKNVRNQAEEPAIEPVPTPDSDPTLSSGVVSPATETPKPIDWKAVFQEAVELAEDGIFEPV